MALLLGESMTVGEAAEVLDVSIKQVQNLGRRGELVYVARGLLDAASVRAYRARRQGRHTRPWSGWTAWAAISLLAGTEPRWLGQPQLSRLRGRLRSMGPADLVAATRARATTRRFAGHEAAVRRLRSDDGVVPGRPLPGLVRTEESDGLVAYVMGDGLGALVDRQGLQEGPWGQIVLHVIEPPGPAGGTGFSLGLVRQFMALDILPPLDAAVSDDPRERGRASDMLREFLDNYRADA